MAISAEERRELEGLAAGVFGDRGAGLLMAGLAAQDLQAMEDRLTQRIDLVRVELQGGFDRQFGELRAEMGELRGQMGELRGEFKDLRGELRGQMGELRGEMGELRGAFGELRADLSTQRMVLYFAIVSTVLGILGLIYTAYQAGQ